LIISRTWGEAQHCEKSKEEAMKKSTWKVHTIAKCDDCGKEWQSHTNGQALAALHAKTYGHVVHGEVGLAFEYDGRKNNGNK